MKAPAAKFDHDLIVIGGGSGGLSAALAAHGLGAKVVMFDYVKPSPKGTTWKLGGTCVNVGCMPKIDFHHAGIVGSKIHHDAPHLGWGVDPNAKLDWAQLVQTISDHVGSLSWAYRSACISKQKSGNFQYINAFAEFVDPHTVSYDDFKGKSGKMTAANIVVAVGGRPQYPDIPGAKEFGVSSDDLFTLPEAPGKTLIVGASYIALECAGFLSELAFPVSVMIRSVPLRSFDRECANKIQNTLKLFGVNFIEKSQPTAVVKDPQSGKLIVKYETADSKEVHEDTFDTVLWAIGRVPVTKDLHLDKAGVKMNANGRIPVVNEQTNVPHIYAIGDCQDGHPELTPVAIRAGALLAQRLFGHSKEQVDYNLIPTVVFTPIEYGSVGYTEEQAIAKFGEANVDAYLSEFSPPQFAVTHFETRAGEELKNCCFAKLLVNKADHNRVIGLHIIAPNAGESLQGFTVAMRCGATKEDFDKTMAIHPIISEEFTMLKVTRRSGLPYAKAGCCAYS